MALRSSLPINYDRATLETWEAIFGESLTSRIESQLRYLMDKYPASADRISIEFSGDISMVTPEDVANCTARVNARAMVEATQTLRGKISSAYRTLFGRKRSGHESTVKEKKIQRVILCNFVIIPVEDEKEIGKGA